MVNQLDLFGEDSIDAATLGKATHRTSTPVQAAQIARRRRRPNKTARNASNWTLATDQNERFRASSVTAAINSCYVRHQSQTSGQTRRMQLATEVLRLPTGDKEVLKDTKDILAVTKYNCKRVAHGNMHEFPQ